MNRNPFRFVEIPVLDLDRASNFYRTLFNLKLKNSLIGETHYAMFYAEKNHTHGALVFGEGYVPSRYGPLVYFESHGDIDLLLQQISDLNGEIIQPKTDLQGHGYVAKFLDCEGNRMAVHAEY